MAWKSSKSNLILSELSTPKSAEDLLKIFPRINKQTIFSTLSIKARQGILAKTDTIPRKYVLRSKKNLFESTLDNNIPTVHERIGSIKKHMPEKFTAIDFAIYWWEQGYDYYAVRNSFDYILSILKRKNIVDEVGANHYSIKKENINPKTHAIHKKVENKILCGFNTYFPIDVNTTENDEKVTCRRCLRDMILELVEDGGKSQKKKWMQTDIYELRDKLKKLKLKKIK